MSTTCLSLSTWTCRPPSARTSLTCVTDSDSLQASADILQQNMRSLLTVQTQHNELFTRLAVHPSTNFPGRTQENILLQLLRKKPEPDVAAAMDEGRKTYEAMDDSLKAREMEKVGTRRRGDDDEDDYLDNDDDDDDDDDEYGHAARSLPMNRRWKAIDAWIGKRAQRFITDEFPDDFTAEELEMGIENVRTGLRRKFDVFEDDEDEDEDEDGGAPVAPAAPAAAEAEDDVIMLDRPPPPPPAIPSLQSQASQPGGAPHVDGLTLDNLLRVATLGSLATKG